MTLELDPNLERGGLGGRLHGVRAHVTSPLFANAYALIGSTGITTVLGLAYWVVAARLYPLEEVGRGQTAVNALVILSGIGSFRLMSALTRFLPRGGNRSARLLKGSYAAAALGSVAVGLAYVALFRGSSGIEGTLGTGALAAAAMIGSIVVWSLFTLQDAALTGLRRAVWIPVENGVHAVAKLLLLPAFATAGFLTTGVFASWMIPTVIALVPVNAYIFRRLLPRRIAEVGEREHFTPRTVRRYVAADYVGSLCELAVVNLVPLVIAAQLGLEAVGYFGPTWMIGTTLEHVLVHYGSSLTVEGSSEPHRLAELSRDLLRRSLVLVLPLTIAVVVGTPYLLGFYGGDYADQVGTLLRLCALSLLPRLLVHVVLTAARVRRDVTSVVGIQAALAILTFVVTMPLLDRFGLTAPGIGFLAASIVVALATLPRLVSLLREGRP